MREGGGQWQPKIKLSEQPIKTSIPGRLQVRRYFDETGQMRADQIRDTLQPNELSRTLVDPGNTRRRMTAEENWTSQDLLQPLVRDGHGFAEVESLSTMRERAADQLQKLHPSIRRLLNPHAYPVGIEAGLFDRREQLMESS